MLSRYSKTIGALTGNLVAIGLVYLGTQGIAECVPDPLPGADEVCTLWGLSTAQLTGAAMAIFNSAFVYTFPANTPQPPS